MSSGETPITQLPGLSWWARQALLRAGILTLGMLRRRSDQELLQIPNFNETSLRNVRYALEQFAPEECDHLPCDVEALGRQFGISREALRTLVRLLPDLSIRALNCLRRAGITTVGDLVSRTDEELLSIPNFGIASLCNVKDAVRRFAKGERATSSDLALEVQCGIRYEAEADIQRTPLSLLPDLSVRAFNCLGKAGITTVGDLVSRTDEELLSIPNFGITSLCNVKDAVRRFAKGEREGLDPVLDATLWERGLVVPDAALGQPIEELDLPAAILGCLRDAGVEAIGDIPSLTERQLQSVPGVRRTLIPDLGEAVKHWRPPPRSVSEVFEVSLRVLTERETGIVSKRWGIQDGDPKTLEEIAQEYGLSKARIGQILAKARRKLHRISKAQRRLGPIQEVIRIADSCTEVATSQEDLMRHLELAGLPPTAEELRMVQFFIDLGWMEVPSALRVDMYSVMPIIRGEEKLANILRLAQRHAGNTGGAHAEAIARELEAPSDEVREVLLTSPLFVRVVDDWFVLTEARRPFLTNVRLMHTYCGDHLPLRSVRAGLRKRHARHPQHRLMPAPPSEVIGMALSTMSEFCIDAGFSHWKFRGDAADDLELSGSIQRLLCLFDEEGPLLTYPEIRQGLLAAGFSPATVPVVLTSPLVHKIEYSLYARSGVELSWGQVAEARSRRAPEITAGSTLTYLRSGVIVFETNTGGWTESGVVASGHLDRLGGRWLISVNGIEQGTLTVRNNFAYGLTQAFTALAVERGDRIRLSFDVRDRVVDVCVIGRTTTP